MILLLDPSKSLNYYGGNMYELFGTRNGLLEFLGVFHTEDFALKAYDNFWGCGYQNLKLCKWKIK